ncbi:MAG: MarR family winged helix-turn-helix transcriptional regulator [Pseudomonadota bacterium]
MAIEDDTKDVRSNSLGWMIQRIAQRLNDTMAEQLAPHDLTLQHFAVMMTVLEHAGLTQTEIGARFAMPPYAISRAIDHLVEKGFVERHPHPTSRRAHTIHATEAGQALSGTLFAIVRDVNAGFTAPLSEPERESFRSILTRLM